MTDVEIEYCVPCGHLNNAEDVQHALLEQFGQEIDGVRLKTGANGTFVVRVDGDAVFDKAEDDYDVDEITRRVRDRVGASA